MTSRGLLMSSSTVPAMESAPAIRRMSREAAPDEALTRRSAPLAASAKVASPIDECWRRHVEKGGVPMASASVRASVSAGSRVPITTG